MAKRHVILARPTVMLHKGLGFSHAHKGGRLVLKGQTSFYTMNGVWINTPWFSLWLLFRRVA
jgi:hypothetical protein